MIITVASFKGGVGKTTTAVHLATYLHSKGETLLIDGDPNRSATGWAKRGNLPFKVRHPRQSRWLNECDRLKGGCPCPRVSVLMLELTAVVSYFLTSGYIDELPLVQSLQLKLRSPVPKSFRLENCVASRQTVEQLQSHSYL